MDRSVTAKPVQGQKWAETEQGYINEAKQSTVCLLRNRRYMRRPLMERPSSFICPRIIDTHLNGVTSSSIKRV